MRKALAAIGLSLSLSACQTDGGNPLNLFGGPDAAQQGPMIAAIAADKPAIAVDPAKRKADLSAVMLASQGMMEVPALEAYANAVLARLMEQAPRKVPDAHVYILSDSSPGAFAYPSGAIFVTQGLLGSLKNEDELAFFLSHELSHLVLQHSQSDTWIKLQRYALMAGETYVGMRQTQNGGLPNWLLAGYAGTIVSRDMVSPARTRSEEDEADRLGTDLVIRAGYNVNAAGDTIKLMVQAEQQFGRDDAVQLTTLEQALKTGYEDGAKRNAQNNNNNLPQKALDQLLTDIGNSQREMRRNHRAPEERLTELNAYIDRHYADAPSPKLNVQGLAAAMSAPATKSVLDNYRLAKALPELAEKANSSALKPKDRKKAQAEFQSVLDQLSKPPSDRDNYVRLQVGEFWRKAGRQDLWMHELDMARKSGQPSVAVYSQLAAAHQARGDNAAALAAIEEALQRFDEPGALFPPAIELARSIGKQDKARMLALRCRLVAPEMASTCAQRAG